MISQDLIKEIQRANQAEKQKFLQAEKAKILREAQKFIKSEEIIFKIFS